MIFECDFVNVHLITRLSLPYGVTTKQSYSLYPCVEFNYKGTKPLFC